MALRAVPVGVPALAGADRLKPALQREGGRPEPSLRVPLVRLVIHVHQTVGSAIGLGEATKRWSAVVVRTLGEFNAVNRRLAEVNACRGVHGFLSQTVG